MADLESKPPNLEHFEFTLDELIGNDSKPKETKKYPRRTLKINKKSPFDPNKFERILKESSKHKRRKLKK